MFGVTKHQILVAVITGNINTERHIEKMKQFCKIVLGETKSYTELF
jgi:hypothetical protein